MTFEIDHVGAVVDAITKRYAGSPLPEDPDVRQRVLDAYRVQRHDVEDAMNQMLGRDPEMHRPPRLSWDPLIELLAEHSTTMSEDQIIAMPFEFEFSAKALVALGRRWPPSRYVRPRSETCCCHEH